MTNAGDPGGFPMPTAPGETGTMSTYQPTLRDRLAELLGKGAEATGMQPRDAAAYGRQATGLADLLPGIGSGLAASEIAPAVKRGDYGTAALNTLGAVPDVGGPAKAMILGVLAKTADRKALKLAEEMAAKGAGRDEIMQATGWFKGLDDKWRFEISDEAARMKGAPAELGDTVQANFQHDDLFKAYPELGADRMQPLPEGRMRGGYVPAAEEGGRGTLHLRPGEPGQMRKTALHELQHGVQTIEGFARGAHPDEYARGPMFNRAADALVGDLNRALAGGNAHALKPHEIIDYWGPTYREQFNLDAVAAKHGFNSLDDALTFLKRQDEMRTPWSQYQRTAGEVEARNVPTRADMTAEERRATPPYKTEDTPPGEQIVRKPLTRDELAASMDPLPGAPPHVEGPVPEVAKAAEDYANKRGFKLDRQKRYAEANPRRGRYIAQAYDKMQHAPADPKVAASYKALADETMGQWQQLQDAGAKIEFIKPGMPDPYPGGPREALADLRANHHLWVFPSEQGFGTVNKIADNPLLASTGIKHGGHDMTVNDAFRAVHDYFGHGMEGANFGARGEENAWQAHKRLFSDEALPALTSETRGQNSWVNFGPFGERNRANQRDTVFADQKTGLLPRWAMKEGGMPLSYRALQAGTGGALLAALALRGSTPRRPDE